MNDNDQFNRFNETEKVLILYEEIYEVVDKNVNLVIFEF